ncbi:putative secondary metabolism biosynthetic enzyme [Arachnomyces sp. PD_36]|nr:putative secondary metabolism biosynthetic enzyme [Arachnomyces sp. PD_36]
MAILDVPGASLYYETRGNGPPLILIPGANGGADVFQQVAEHLSKQFTVVTYDRRGFSRSLLRGAQDYERRLETDADDVKSLIEFLTPEPAILFGNSSGAIVALSVLLNHPSKVVTVVAHEPPTIRVLPDNGAKWRAFFRKCYDVYRQRGVPPAMELFASEIAEGAEAEAMPRAMDPANGGFIPANTMYWFERELLEYTEVEFDLQKLEKDRSKLILAKGSEVRPRSLFGPVVEALASRLNVGVTELPGPHLGYLFYPEGFAEMLLAVLKG